ncbi:cation channel sperm-associated auxiliary subunit beta-like [Ptychodera flava]|uniref:cation channel sperm-associated auxiliary subunit beta-like n=1 Tax=Ptychodera flava TaxID=63121 RepID=UPI003969C62E
MAPRSSKCALQTAFCGKAKDTTLHVILFILSTFSVKTSSFESYKLRVGSVRGADGKLDNRLVLQDDHLVVLCDLVDLTHDTVQRSQVLYQEFTSLGHTPSLTISNDTWRETFPFMDDSVKKEWSLYIDRNHINAFSDSQGQWKVVVELVEGSGIFHVSTSLLDISGESLLRWSVSGVVDKGVLDVSTNVSSILVTQSACSPDIVMAFVQTTLKFQVALIGVSYGNFQENYTFWYDLLPTLCELNPHECNGVKFMDAILTENHLIVFTTHGFYVSDDLTAHNGTGQVLEFIKIEISGVYNGSSNLQHLKIWYKEKCDVAYTCGQYCQDEYTSLIVSSEAGQDSKRVYVSSAPYRVWFDLTSRIEGQVIALLQDDKKGNMIVLKTQENDDRARVAVYNFDNPLFTNTTTDTFSEESKPFPEFTFPEDFHASGLFLHPHCYALYVLGTQVWVSSDGGNLFTRLLKLPDGETVVRWTANQHHDTVVFTTDRGKTYYGSAGVSRLVLISLAVSKTIPGVHLDFQGNVHLVEWLPSTSKLQARQIDIPNSIQIHETLQSSLLAMQPFTDKEVYLFEYIDYSRYTSIFTRANLWKTLNFSSGGKVLIIAAEEFPSPDIFRSYIKGYVISPLKHESSNLTMQSLGIAPFNRNTAYLEINATEVGWSSDDVGKTIVSPRQTSVLLTEYINNTHMVGQSVTALKSDFQLQPSRWRLYNLRNWTLAEDECQHVLIPDEVVSRYPMQYLDVGDNFTFSVSAIRKNGILPDAKPLLYVTVSSPHLVKTDSRYSVDKHGYQMLTVTLRHEVYFPGKVKVTVHLWQASLKCPKTSYTVTILCSCPPGKRLRYEYPYVISMEDYLHGNPKDDTFRKRPLLFDLEVNYRPPSKYGIAIPMSPHVYNVDPSKAIPRSMFHVSQESWRFSSVLANKAKTSVTVQT